MDRHICRAKEKCTNKWVYGYYVCTPNERNDNMVNLIISQMHILYGNSTNIQNQTQPNLV